MKSAARTRAINRVVIGSVGGIAWAAALRSYMAEINAPASTVDWVGTFVAVLLPGAVVGACLAAAAVVPAPANRSVRVRWLAASPLLFAVFPFALPGALLDFLTQGLGSGAIGVAAGGIAGGYALGGGRRRWARLASAACAGALIIGLVLSVPLIGGTRLAITTPRGAWVAVLAATLMIVLCLACAIPFRRLTALAHRAGSAPVRTEQTIGS